MSELSYECPLCDEYFTERYLRKHLMLEHTDEEKSDLLASIVVRTEQEDLQAQLIQ